MKSYIVIQSAIHNAVSWHLSSHSLTLCSYPLLLSFYLFSCPLTLSSYLSSCLLPLLFLLLLSPVLFVFLFVTLVFLSVFVCVCDSSVILNSAWHDCPQVVDTASMVSNIGRGSNSIGVSSVGYGGSIGNWGNSMNIGLSSNFFMDKGLCSNVMSFH